MVGKSSYHATSWVQGSDVSDPWTQEVSDPWTQGPTQPTQQYNKTSTALLYTLIDPSHGHFLLNRLCRPVTGSSYNCSTWC